MEEKEIKKIVERIKELTTEKNGYCHFEYAEIRNDGIYFDGSIDNIIFVALEIVKTELNLRIDIQINSHEDCNDEQFYIRFYNK